MKPRDWAALSAEQKREMATGLPGSMRGIYIVSQALHYAIKAMRAVPEPHREESNIEDMEMLREGLFSFPIFDADVPPRAE